MQDYRIIHNAIPIEKFAYSQEKAERINREFGLEGKTVYGHIANFIASKNHSFLLEVFARIRTKDPKAVLICLGDGQLRPEIEEKIRQLELTDEVILAVALNVSKGAYDGYRTGSTKTIIAFLSVIISLVLGSILS
ncbi:MAG: glycosyltransferase, partial [Peptococcaceae bacterium]|nr:glycosyltransferase [Peptococcaceae bacterium]